MGGRKYNAPEDVNKWVPITTKNVKLDCKSLVQGKCLFGCINEEFIKDWKRHNAFLISCDDCKVFEKKEEKIVKQKRTKKIKGDK